MEGLVECVCLETLFRQQANSSKDTYLEFPDLYDQGWRFDRIQGVVKAWFGEGYLGLSGSHLRGIMAGSHVGGSFAIARPQARYEQRLSLFIDADQLDLLQAKTFVFRR